MSTDQVRDELLAAVMQLGRLRPAWRLGQLLANLAMTAGRMDAGGVWDMEDDEALAAARELIQQHAGQEAALAESSADRGHDPGSSGHDGSRAAPAAELRRYM